MVHKATVPRVDDEIEPTAARARVLESARASLDELAQLPDDWDSYGAARPTAEAIAAARGLLTGLWEALGDSVDESTEPWATAPLADGGVQFEWRGPHGAIEVEIGPDGTLNYLVERDERTIRHSDPNRGAPASEVLDQVHQVLGRA